MDQLIALRIPLRIISHVISARALENARLGLAIDSPWARAGPRYHSGGEHVNDI